MLHAKDNDQIWSIIRILFCQYWDSDRLSFQTLVNCFMLFYTELSRLFSSTYTQDTLQANKTPFERILEHIQHQYRFCTLAETASRFGYTTGYLSALIKKKCGKTFSELRRDYRMEGAASLLKDPDSKMTIVEIAEYVGYSNPPYFYRAFQNHYGMTPNAYRSLHTKE